MGDGCCDCWQLQRCEERDVIDGDLEWLLEQALSAVTIRTADDVLRA